VNNQPEPDRPRPTTRRRPTGRGIGFAAAYGVIVAALGLLIARGNPFWAVVVMIIIGAVFRVGAYLLIRRHGRERTPWWKWL
jgi:hypothetical protein